MFMSCLAHVHCTCMLCCTTQMHIHFYPKKARLRFHTHSLLLTRRNENVKEKREKFYASPIPVFVYVCVFEQIYLSKELNCVTIKASEHQFFFSFILVLLLVLRLLLYICDKERKLWLEEPSLILYNGMVYVKV